jgi:dTDP-4-dehydrorhamnose reductase
MTKFSGLPPQRILILGATGMLGSCLFRAFANDEHYTTFGTIRAAADIYHFAPALRTALISDVQVEHEAGVLKAMAQARPDVVINCVGIIKQLPSANDHLMSLTVNASLPHRLAKYCEMAGARLVHFSTDCVFSGKAGGYREDDFADADDVYGRTKLLGEVTYDHTITLRTSIIGHELASAKSLIDWFLSQESRTNGYVRAVFSGLPTIEMARVLKQYVLPRPALSGLYHLSVAPINKFDLLQQVAKVYGSPVEILPDDRLVIDRSLNSEQFRAATGYSPEPWPELITAMHADYLMNREAAAQQ